MVPMRSLNPAGPDLARLSSPVPTRSSKRGSKEASVMKPLDDTTCSGLLVGWTDGW